MQLDVLFATQAIPDSALEEVQVRERPDYSMYWYRFFRQRYINHYTRENLYNFEELVRDSTTYLNQQIRAGQMSGTFPIGEHVGWAYDLESLILRSFGRMFMADNAVYDLKIYKQRK